MRILSALLFLAGCGPVVVGPNPAPSPSASPIPICIPGNASWNNESIGTQSSDFQIDFDVTPSVFPADEVIGLSTNIATGYTSNAAIVRFNDSGFIDSISGPSYQPSTIPYVAGMTYHISMQIFFETETYNSSVNGQAIGVGFSFRDTQATATQLDYLNNLDDEGTETICNMNVSPIGGPSPVPLPSPSPSVIPSSSPTPSPLPSPIIPIPIPSLSPSPLPSPSPSPSPTVSPVPSPTPSPIPSPTPSPSPVPILTGNYCTIEDFENVYSPSIPMPMSVVCNQPDGTWKSSNPTSYPTTDDGGDYYDGATLTADGIGNIFVTEKLEFDDLFMWSYSPTQGWQEAPEVNSNTGSPCTALGGSSYVHTYFGPSIAIYNQMPVVLWDSQFICNSGGTVGNSRVWLSQWNGLNWSHTDLADPSDAENYAKIYISPTTNLLYAYWASPSIAIRRLNADGSVYPFTLGAPDNDPNYPDNYFMSLTEWNGQLVMSFSESNGSLTQNQALTTAITQVAYYDGSIWHNLGAPIEDTPGNLEYDDYLFTYGGNLYVMYADFTTNGPGLAHLRIKEWSGTTWIRMGGESPIIAYARRLEPLQDGSGIILGAIFESQQGNFWEHSVYRFDVIGGTWTQVGAPIKQCNPGGWNGCSSVFRPGAVVKVGQ